MRRVVFFREASGKVPLLLWQDGLTQKARAHLCEHRETSTLRHFGHELRRPEAEYLADGIYELRFRCERPNYRVLYFFHGREVVVISHGITKQQARVPVRELELARRRKREYLANPARHSHGEA